MPDFLQTKQTLPNNSFYNFKQAFLGVIKKRSFLVLIVLILAIPLTVWIAQRAQIFSPRAGNGTVELVSGTDSCVVSNDPNKVSCASFPIKLTSPLGPKAEVVLGCNSDNQCPANNTCYKYQSYPGNCRPEGTACAQVITRACNPEDEDMCEDFPTPCHVPPGWVVGNPSPVPSSSVSASPSGNSISCTNDNQCPNGMSCQFSQTPDSCPDNTQACQDYLNSIPKICKPQPSPSASASSVPNDSVAPSPTPLAAPSFFDISGNACENQVPKITLVWSSVTGASEYNVYRRADDENNFNLIAGHLPNNLTSFVDNGASGIQSNKRYFYKMTAAGPNGVSPSSFSETVPTTTLQCNTSTFRWLRNVSLDSVLGQFRVSQVSAQFSADLNTGLVAFWKFDETSGVTVSDSIGSNTATATNTEIVEGRFGKGRKIGTANSQVATGDSSGFGSNQMSVAGWVKPGAFGVGNYGSIFNRRNSQNNSGMTLEYNGSSQNGGSGQLQCNYFIKKTNNQLESINLLSVGNDKLNSDQWNHVACTYDGNSGRLYINGRQVASQNLQGVINQGSNMQVQMGRNLVETDDLTANAVLDEIGVWNRGLSASEVSALANGSLPVISSPSPTPTVSSSPTSQPSASGDLPGTNFYKLAETEGGLAGAVLVPYNNHPTTTNFTFSNSNPGVKQIWVEFIGPNNITRREHISVELLEPSPQVTSLDCSMDILKQNLKLTLKGNHFSESRGKLFVDGKEAQVSGWNNTEVTGTIKPDGNLEERLFKVKITKNDNTELQEVACQVNTTLVSLGARLFCREPGKFDVNGVKVTLVDEQGNKVNEEVTIDSEGIIKGLKTRLQTGKAYSISIKAPVSLRSNAEFTAANGTNVITPDAGSVFILPTGDIAPVVLADGKINTLDRAEIVRQWSVLGATNRTADFNKDSVVNSIDWACMRFDFNKEDAQIPDRATGTPSGSSPLPTASIAPIPSASPSALPSPAASPSPSPLPSGQRSAYFLLEPLEGGTYVNGDEFIVDVKIWSQIEPANLFVAKMAFDPAAIEVVRIEKGAILTTWAEEFFNNQTGQISLVAGKPNPGLKTVQDDDPRMARIVFRAKQVGTTDITFTSASKIYSNVDNSNILSSLLSAQIAITTN